MTDGLGSDLAERPPRLVDGFHAGGGQTLVSGTVRDLTLGKGIEYESMGVIALKGFPEPIALYEVVWHDA